MEMRGIVPAGIMIAAALLFQAALVLCSFPATLKLERAFPLSQRVELSQLRARDSLRHGRMLQSSNGVVDFPVAGTYPGLYYTKVHLGSPPKEFNVQIDTGSDVPWVNCNSCNGCPTTSGLQIPLNFFDTGSSSTASWISCSDQRCSAAQSPDVNCSSQNQCPSQNPCTYDFSYADQSGTSGCFVSDLLYFDPILSVTANSSARITFGCSTSQKGGLTKSDLAVDGIFGFGQEEISVVSQLASQGVAPKAFSHCLRGDKAGGGILVLGEILEPHIVYTPLVPSPQPHYNLNLQSISVSGQTLSIDPSVFTTSNNQGTIIDSGTTLAYLAEAAYKPFVTAVTNAVSQYAQPVVYQEKQCYLNTSSVTDVFPQVSLNFSGGASMILRPQDYLLQQGNSSEWCIVLHTLPGEEGLTILGDLVLKDKLVVYDLAGQRIGWANYDCSTSVNVTASMKTGKSEYVNAGQLDDNSSPQNEP